MPPRRRFRRTAASPAPLRASSTPARPSFECPPWCLLLLVRGEERRPGRAVVKSDAVAHVERSSPHAATLRAAKLRRARFLPDQGLVRAGSSANGSRAARRADWSKIGGRLLLHARRSPPRQLRRAARHRAATSAEGPAEGCRNSAEAEGASIGAPHLRS